MTISFLLPEARNFFVQLNDRNENEMMLDTSHKNVIVLFHSPECPYSRNMKQVFREFLKIIRENMKKNIKHELQLATVNTTKNPEVIELSQNCSNRIPFVPLTVWFYQGSPIRWYQGNENGEFCLDSLSMWAHQVLCEIEISEEEAENEKKERKLAMVKRERQDEGNSESDDDEQDDNDDALCEEDCNEGMGTSDDEYDENDDGENQIRLLKNSRILSNRKKNENSMNRNFVKRTNQFIRNSKTSMEENPKMNRKYKKPSSSMKKVQFESNPKKTLIAKVPNVKRNSLVGDDNVHPTEQNDPVQKTAMKQPISNHLSFSSQKIHSFFPKSCPCYSKLDSLVK